MWILCSKNAKNFINKIQKSNLRVEHEMEDANLEDILTKI